MANSTLPSRIAGRNVCFCSSVPNCIRVGPTVLSVTSGIGALTRLASSAKMNCSIAEKPRPPNSLGQPTPRRSAAASARRPHAVAYRGAALHPLADGSLPLRRHHPLHGRANLVAQLLLFGGVVESHRSGPQPYRHPLDTGHHGGSHPVDLSDQLEP